MNKETSECRLCGAVINYLTDRTLCGYGKCMECCSQCCHSIHYNPNYKKLETTNKQKVVLDNFFGKVFN